MGLDLYLIKRNRYTINDVMYWRKQWWVVDYFRKFGKTLDDESGFPLTKKEIDSFVSDCKRVIKEPSKRRSILGINPSELDKNETVLMLQNTVKNLENLEDSDYALYASY